MDDPFNAHLYIILIYNCFFFERVKMKSIFIIQLCERIYIYSY